MWITQSTKVLTEFAILPPGVLYPSSLTAGDGGMEEDVRGFIFWLLSDVAR